MAGRILQTEAFQRAVRDVIDMQQEHGVHHMPPENIKPVIGNGTVRHSETAGAPPRRTAVPADSQLDPALPGPFHEIGQVKIENIVAFNHIRIALVDHRHQPLEHVGFRHVRLSDQLLPAGLVADPDGQDAVAFPFRVAELIARGRMTFDVHLHPAQFLKRQALEKRAAGGEQMLADRVVDEQVGRRGGASGHAAGFGQYIFGRTAGVPSRKPHQHVERVATLQRNQPGISKAGVQQRGFAHDKRFKGLFRSRGFPVTADKQAHVVPIILLDMFNRHQAGVRIRAKQKRIIQFQHPASLPTHNRRYGIRPCRHPQKGVRAAAGYRQAFG